MSMLRSELEALRERMLEHEADLAEVQALQRMTQRMIHDDSDGRFFNNLHFIELMLEGIGQTVSAQQRLSDAVDQGLL
jgi:hypothetical protein